MQKNVNIVLEVEEVRKIKAILSWVTTACSHEQNEERMIRMISYKLRSALKESGNDIDTLSENPAQLSIFDN